MLKRFLQPKIFLPLLLVLLSFLVYWFTKPPSILWVDSGTMIAASYSLGIPNPPGFPFYMLASHIFAILPIFNVLTRLELFTIVFSCLALVLIYKIILTLLEDDFFFYKPSKEVQNIKNIASKYKYFAAFFGAAALAFSYEYWSQSQNTEAFIFTDFFLILFIFIFIFLERKRKELLYKDNSSVNIPKFASIFFKTMLCGAFLYGLASGTNPTIAALIPASLYILYLNRRILSIPKILILGGVFLFTALAVYMYLPIRASAWPFVNWGNPQTLSNFIGHIRGQGLNIYEPQTNSINGFTGSPVVFLQSVSHFFYLLLVVFTPILVPFIFLGGYFIYKKNKYLFITLFSVILVDVVYAGLYYSGNQESWFILSWIICAIFIGIGVYFTLLKFNISSNFQKILLLLWLLPLLFWFIPLNRSGDNFSSDYAYNLYSTLGKNAVLIETGDFTNSLGYYLHEADKYRADVTPVTANTFYVNKWYRDSLRHSSNIDVSPNLENVIQYKAFDEYNRAMNEFIADNINKRPIYVTHLTLRASALAGTSAGQLILDPRFKFVPHGLSLQVVKAEDDVIPDMKAFNYRFDSPLLAKPPFYLERNYTTGYKNILNDYAYGYEALGDWYFNAGAYDEAYKYYQKADELVPQNAEILSRFGQYFGVKKNYDVSRQFFEAAVGISPDNLTLRFNLANTLALMGKTDEAKQEYDIIQQTIPGQELANDAKAQEQNMLNNSTKLPQVPLNPKDESAYKNEAQNYTFYYQKDWILTSNPDKTVSVTNQKQDKSQINILVFGGKLKKDQTVEDFVKSSPLNPKGVYLDSKNISVPGFIANVQIWGNQNEAIQLYVLQKQDFVYLINVSPGDSTSILSGFNPLLLSFRSLHD